MAGINYHGALAPLEEACRLTNANVLYVCDLMSPATSTDSLKRKFSILLRHLKFAWTVYRNRKRDLIVVRDFSNVPLAAVFPMVLYMKNKMVFIVNHNLQWTIDNSAERAAFRWLGRMGCRFAFLEQIAENVLKDYGIDPLSCLALPHPVPKTTIKRCRPSGVMTIGVIGHFRSEKNMDELLDVLAPLNQDYCILLGIPNIKAFHNFSEWSDAQEFKVVDTSAHQNYMQTIAECDVIVLNHPPDAYRLRASGLIADAAAAHVPVIARNLPVLHHQISYPVPIGQSFKSLSDVPACIEIVSQRLGNEEYEFDCYNQARSPESLALLFEQSCI